MFKIGQKIRLWRFHTETLQFLVSQQHMLTVTELRDDGKYFGITEEGVIYSFENGSWWAESAGGEMVLAMAVNIWNTAMRDPEANIRVILIPGGRNIVPDGDVEKCEKHNRYSIIGNSCFLCRVEARLSTKH